MKNIIRKKYHIIVFLLKLSIFLLLTPIVYNYIPVKTGKSTFYLPSSDINSVIDTLENNGYSVWAIDKLMLKYFKTPPKGWYTIKKTSQKRFNFFESLLTQRAKTMRVKIYAGETSIELTKRLARDLKLDQKKLILQYRRLTRFLEGDIFAGRYVVARKADERAIISALFQISAIKLKEFGSRYCEDDPNPLEIKILLIIASIIQKETNNPKEMYLVSSVIQNRLDRGMKLQMDGTLNYGKYAHKAVTSKRIKKDKSYYNTYKHGGIPPAPLCTVSINALKAALNPKKTNYLYFMLNKKGKHDFASSYKQHVKNIKAFRN
ncbi:MAG: endolytic transglycosylase MltG [Epsilonproteobacteria bacterium]|nr:MAG: endolytic transglycosylase MltG [Campylobacterota bacterium]